MSDWAKPTKGKIPARVHRNVSLVLAADAVVAEEVISRPKIGPHLAGRLSDTVLLVKAGAVDKVIAELLKIGHTPRIEGAK